jgi:hypothetical protein
MNLREFFREVMNRVCIIFIRSQRRKLQCPETGEGKVRVVQSCYVIVNCQLRKLKFIFIKNAVCVRIFVRKQARRYECT